MPYSPPVVLTDFQSFGKPAPIGGDSPLKQPISVTNSITLSPTRNVFSIEFSALSYTNPEQNRYRYRLEGLETGWNETSSAHRRVTYTTLPPGDYTFRVQGSNNRGLWNERGVALRLHILPPWWSTWWFRVICGSLVLASLWALYRLRIRQLQNQERKLLELIETIPTGAWIVRPDGSNEFVNQRWVEYTGLSAKDTAGLGWQAVIHPEDLKRHMEKWRASLASGEPFEDEARFRRAADGEYGWFLSRGVPLRDKHGSILKWYGIVTDIEDRKRAEEEREKLHQLEANLTQINRASLVGELAASLSHELNQPIAAATTSASACLRWLARNPPDLERARGAAMRIEKDGSRAAEIIQRLRAFYKTGAPPQRELVDINEVVGEMLVLLRGEANRYSISMRTELAPQLPPIMADRVQVQQVLMNLMLNGIEAMRDGAGELTIRSQSTDDGLLLISVSDTGVGLPSEKVDKIFNAFYTTKPQGAGMGLAISRSIVEAHGGRLWATGNSPRGACFHLSLPAKVEVHE